MNKMEQSHSLLLNEEALAAMPDAKKAVFIYEWLRYLDRILPATQKNDIKGSQAKLVDQLRAQMVASPTPPKDGQQSTGPGAATRVLLARTLATLYSVGDSYSLYKTINDCNDILKNRDDSPSQLPTKLAAICCVGAMYEKLGRLVGPGFEETTQILIKALRNAESQGRTEIILTFEKMLRGLGSAGSGVHKDIYKAVRASLTDRVMSVRAAAATCLTTLGSEASWLWQNELEAVVALALKALDGSNYETRTAIAKLLGYLIATAHSPPKMIGKLGAPQASSNNQLKSLGLEECLNLLSSGFLRGGTGFLKGTSGVASNLPKEIRIGISMSYVEFVKTLGSSWLERNLGLFTRLVLELAGQPGKQTSTANGSNPGHIEAVYIRRCVNFILHSTVGKLLGEKSQTNACKELGHIIAEQMNSIDFSVEASQDRILTPEIIASNHLLVCALQELSALVQQIGTSVTPLFTEASGILEPVFSCLLHPCLGTRLAGAWCLRCVTMALPALLTPLIDRCLTRLEHMKASADAISGYSLALSALLGGSYQCPLGIPFGKGKQIFGVAEDLIRTASQSSRLATVKTQAGWRLIAAVTTLGPSLVRHHLPRMLLLWKNAFPRSTKEADAERQRGDAFTWTCTLEGREGALCAMQSFFTHCQDLATDDVLRRILGPIDAALSMLGHMPNVSRHFGQQLRIPIIGVRLRLYGVLSQISPKYYESCFSGLLRELVAEISLTESGNMSGGLATSLLAGLCHPDDRTLLGSWLQDTDHKSIEEQLHPLHSSGCGALEHDPFILCTREARPDFSPPAPLPLAIAAIDASLMVFGKVFPYVPTKHRLQMLDHFGECIKTTKPGPRQQAMQINVFTGLLISLKTLGDQKRTLEGEAVQRSAVNLIVGSLGAPSPLLRCAAAEALGRLAQAVADPNFVAGMAQFSFDKLKTCRDVVNRTGHSLALGCLHRYVGSLGSGQHLNTSVSILLALAQDNSSPVVQVWSLHALGLIADTGGPMFRGYVEPTLSLCLKLLLTTPPWSPDVAQCLGKLMSALITTVGPELQQNVGNIVPTRSSFLVGCAIMTGHSDPLVQSEAVACLQQLHLFAQRHVNLSSLVPQLCGMLKSPHLILRKSAVSCLRQLVQREAKEVREHALTLLPPPPSAAPAKRTTMLMSNSKEQEPLLPETGLEGALFALLDMETDPTIVGNIKEALLSLVTALASEMLSHWLSLCKDILAATSSDLLSPVGDEKLGDGSGNGKDGKGDDNDADEDDDIALPGSSSIPGPQYSKILPRWHTRVFAVEIVQKLIGLCETERAHLDLALAKELQLSGGKSDYLVLHLSDLIRMAFMAATSDNTDLRLAGLSCLQDIINKFSRVPEPEFPGHVILEQFQAQVGAALRPAFTPETPSHVTAAACQVCSTWIGSGVARDLNDLRRVHQLLVSSLAKLKRGSISTQLYSESAATLEKLAILKAWAEVYIVAMRQQKEIESSVAKNDPEIDDGLSKNGETSLLSLVTPELTALISHWLAALRDNALLSLPAEFNSQLPKEGGAYYTPETAEACRQHYKQSWPSVLLAATTWLSNNNFTMPKVTKKETEAAANSPARMIEQEKPESKMDTRESRFHLILGTCMEALCSPRQVECQETVDICLRTLGALFDCDWSKGQLMSDSHLPVEVLNVMHRLILTRESLATQSLCMHVVEQILLSAEMSIQKNKDGQVDEKISAKLWRYNGGEGGLNGESKGKLNPDGSIVYALIEVALCLLVRQIPAVNPTVMRGKSALVGGGRKWSRLPPESHSLIATAAGLLPRIIPLCSSDGKLTVLPTVLFLLIGVLREASKISISQNVPDRQPGVISMPAAKALQSLRSLIGNPVVTVYGENGDCERLDAHWVTIIQAALHTVINMQTREDSESQVDETGIMLGTAVFLVGAPNVVTACAQLQSATIQFFRKCLLHENPIIQAKCLQTLQSIFGHPDQSLSVPFIHALAPLLIDKFKEHDQIINPTASEKNDEENGDGLLCASQGLDEASLTVVIEAEKTLETLIATAQDDKRLPIVSLTVQILMSFLLESSSTLKTGPGSLRRLHEFALGRLQQLGPAYPNHFRTVFAHFPELKPKLESALSQNKSQTERKQSISSSKVPPSTKLSKEPAINLSMDFSKFTAK